MSASEPAAILQRLAEAVAERPYFWATLAFLLVFIVLASMACFEKRWLRAIILASLAVEGALFLCGGYV